MRPLDEFVARWTQANIAVPFVDTVNTQVDTDTLPDVWGSAMLQSEERRDVTLGSSPYVEERGNVVVGLFARSGSGRNALDMAVTEIRVAYHGYHVTVPNVGIEYTAVEGPMDVDPNADGEWWRVALNLPYRVFTRRSAVVP